MFVAKGPCNNLVYIEKTRFVVNANGEVILDEAEPLTIECK